MMETIVLKIADGPQGRFNAETPEEISFLHTTAKHILRKNGQKNWEYRNTLFIKDKNGNILNNLIFDYNRSQVKQF